MDDKVILGIVGAAIVVVGVATFTNELHQKRKQKKLEGKINEYDNRASVKTDDGESVKEDNSKKALSPFEDENDVEISMSKLDGFENNNKSS